MPERRDLFAQRSQRLLAFFRFGSIAADEEGLARQRFPAQAEVLVFPHGGITYLILN